MRRLLATTYEIQESVAQSQGAPRDLVERAERAMLEVAHDDRQKDFRTIEEILDAELDKLHRLSLEGTALTGTPTGYKDLDEMTGGFQPGNLIIIAARPSMGKCLGGDTLDLRPDDRRAPARSASWSRSTSAARTCGSPPSATTSRWCPAKAAAVASNGEQELFRLQTRSGRRVELTAGHPLLTLDGWRKAERLRAGSIIAVPRGLPRRIEARRAAARGERGRRRPRSARPRLEADASGERAQRGHLVGRGRVDRAIGAHETFDIEVPLHHNFVAGDVVVHNSALVTNIAENTAIDYNRPVALFSLEMSETELAQRFVASQARIKGDELRKGRVAEHKWPKILEASQKLARSPLFIDDSSDVGLLEIRAKARRLHQQHGLGMIIIDYLQLMRADGRVENRVEQIGQMSRGLKILARELDVPVVALSQLNRGVEQRHDKRPVLSDLRESGSIEQDADLVAFIYREEYYDRETEREGEADIIIAKHRNGGIGDVVLTFQKEYPKFLNYAGERFQ